MQSLANTQTKKLILIIDDDENYREILRLKLKNEGYEVIDVANGEDGLKILNNSRPDLILVDLVMPKMNGVDFLFKLKIHPQGKNIKAIIMTNKVDIKEEIGQQYDKISKKFGAIDFISKTEDLNTLVKKIKNKIES